MQIHYAGKLSKKDSLECCLLHYQQLKFQKWVFGIVLFLILFSFIYLIIYEPATATDLLRASPLSIVFLLVILTVPWWMPYLQASSLIKKGSIYWNNVFGTIDDSEITVNGGAIKSSFQWNAYQKYSITDDMILLYTQKNCFSIFTKGMFTGQAEWDQFIALIRSRLPAHKAIKTAVNK